MQSREELVSAYVHRIIDGMDFKTLWNCALEQLQENYAQYSDEQLLAEVSEFYPDLLENTEQIPNDL
jgi:hypothetical protein